MYKDCSNTTTVNFSYYFCVPYSYTNISQSIHRCYLVQYFSQASVLFNFNSNDVKLTQWRNDVCWFDMLQGYYILLQWSGHVLYENIYRKYKNYCRKMETFTVQIKSFVYFDTKRFLRFN